MNLGLWINSANGETSQKLTAIRNSVLSKLLNLGGMFAPQKLTAIRNSVLSKLLHSGGMFALQRSVQEGLIEVPILSYIYSALEIK